MPTFDNPRRVFAWGSVVLGLVLLAGTGFLILRATAGGLSRFGRPAEPTISQEMVLERLRDVAKLVATEMVLRDVVTFEQTRFGSSKRALLVVSGKIAAGINLRRAEVQIDPGAKRVIVTLPPAEILSVEVLNVTTYDERSGLWNPFTADDRDLIQRRIRTQLMTAARQSGLLEHADESARKTLQTFLKLDGYAVEVRRPLELKQPTG
jgi:uncharacterized protein DUF4230